MLSKLIIFVVLFNISLNCSNCWVLTDIDNRALIDNNLDDLDFELNPEEFAQLRRNIKLIFPGMFLFRCCHFYLDVVSHRCCPIHFFFFFSCKICFDFFSITMY